MLSLLRRAQLVLQGLNRGSSAVQLRFAKKKKRRRNEVVLVTVLTAFVALVREKHLNFWSWQCRLFSFASVPTKSMHSYKIIGCL